MYLFLTKGEDEEEDEEKEEELHSKTSFRNCRLNNEIL